MNFSDIGNLIKDYAPTVGMALSSPVGAVAAIGSIVAKALGSKSDANAIYEAIKQDPVKAEEKIKKELANNVDLQKIILDTLKEKNTREAQVDAHQEKMMELHIQDLINARLSNQGKGVDNFIKITLALGTLFIAITCLLILSFDNNLPADARQSVNNIMFAAFGSGFGQMMAFYFGNPMKQYDVDKMNTDLKTIKNQTNAPTNLLKKTY
jgi:hypothetical protein